MRSTNAPGAVSKTASSDVSHQITPVKQKFNLIAQWRPAAYYGQAYIAVAPWTTTETGPGIAVPIFTNSTLLAQMCTIYKEYKLKKFSVIYNGTAPTTSKAKVYLGWQRDPGNPEFVSFGEYQNLEKSLIFSAWNPDYKNRILCVEGDNKWRPVDPNFYLSMDNPEGNRQCFNGLVHIGFDASADAADLDFIIDIECEFEFRSRQPVIHSSKAWISNTNTTSASTDPLMRPLGDTPGQSIFYDSVKAHTKIPIAMAGYYHFDYSSFNCKTAGTADTTTQLLIYDRTGTDVSTTRKLLSMEWAVSGPATAGSNVGLWINNSGSSSGTGTQPGMDVILSKALLALRAGDVVEFTDYDTNTVTANRTWANLSVRRLRQAEAKALVTAFTPSQTTLPII